MKKTQLYWNSSIAFLFGFLMAFDLFGNIGVKISGINSNFKNTDQENIAADWNNLGQSFCKAMEI